MDSNFIFLPFLNFRFTFLREEKEEEEEEEEQKEKETEAGMKLCSTRSLHIS